MTIGARLTLWYTLVLAAGLGSFAAGVWLIVEHSLSAAVHDGLTRQRTGVITVLETEYNPAHPDHVREELSEYAEASPGGRWISVTSDIPVADTHGVGLLSSLPTPGFQTLSQTVTVHGAVFHIQVALPLDQQRDTLARLRTLLLWSAPLVLAIAALAGYWISRRALIPVDAITRAAQSIGIDNLSDRLPVPASGDELARLAETWNGMLERLEASVKRLTQFTADASHELRTPVALIRTTAEIALRRERTSADYRDALYHIIDESDRTARLVDDLLLLARADAGLPAVPLEYLDLALLVRDVCRQGQVLAGERQLQFAAHTPDQSVFVRANDPALRRLLLVLVDNAVKYTPAGGQVTVSVAHDDAGPSVTVRDTGVGIPPAALPRVFDRFYRVDESRNRDTGGAGLGLSIARWIADRHQAHLEAESAVGHGSTFRLRFPPQ